MKGKKLACIILSLIMSICSYVYVSADTTYCPVNYNGEHYCSDNIKQLESAHPHKAAFTCNCGLADYKDKSYDANCDQCRREMCKGGLHYYKYNVWEDNGCYFGECYCGRLMVLDNSNDFKNHFNRHVPQKEYDDECMVCSWEQSYYEDLVYIYNVDVVYYEEDFTEAEISDDVYTYYDSCQAYVNCQNRAVNTSSSSKCKAHNFENHKSLYNRHPHAGYFKCDCGAKINFAKSYVEECTECQKELCQKGIHCYAAKLVYDSGSNYNGYGICYCGAKQYFTAAKQYAIGEEVYPGVMGKWDELVEVKHPHRQYNASTGTFYSYGSEGTGIRIGACAGCDFESEYSNEILRYELNTIVYGIPYKNGIYTDSNSGNNSGANSYNDYSSSNHNYNNYDDSEEYCTDDELYDWIEQMQEIINS